MDDQVPDMVGERFCLLARLPLTGLQSERQIAQVRTHCGPRRKREHIGGRVHAATPGVQIPNPLVIGKQDRRLAIGADRLSSFTRQAFRVR